jgi:lipopolysaccharide export system protein LptA
MVFLLFGASTSQALDSDRNQPINVRARHVEADQRTGLAVYRGNVVVTQGSLVLHAERLEVKTRDGRSEWMRAFGSPARARMQPEAGAEEVHLSAARIDYDAVAHVAELRGDAIVTQGRNRFAAPYARYDLAAETLQANSEDERRVSAIYYPESAAP